MGTWVRKQRRRGMRALEVRCNSRMMLAWVSGQLSPAGPAMPVAGVGRTAEGTGAGATRGGVKMALESLSEPLQQWVRGVLMAEGEKDLN